jgi:2-dehydro-3-deoxyphosphooctonate aldolase (KDO 8-P synthase)
MSTIRVGNIDISNHAPMVMIGGMNVLEERDTIFQVAEAFCAATQRIGMPYIFKASFDKANRSSIHSFRGPGLEKGLKLLGEVKSRFGVSILTDVHTPEQAAPAAEVCDIIQVPAFLARQTDLIAAMAATKAAINVKKPQFMSPPQIKNIVEKIREGGNERILLCERGSCFGYDNLVVDMLGFRTMKAVSGDLPIIFDATHALQMRDPAAEKSGGRRAQIAELARAGLAIGIAGLFIEAHPDPDKAKCDGPCALPLAKLPAFLEQMKTLDDLVKSLRPLDIDDRGEG